MSRTILVTGGAGFLGSVLVNRLLQVSCSVRVLDSLRFGGGALLTSWNHPAFEFVHGDIRDEATVRRCMRGIDSVVHLAAIVGDPACARTPDEAQAVNVDATLLLFEESARANVSTFLLASTCSNYGVTGTADTLADENTDLAPLSLYARTKVQCEQMLLNGSSTQCPAVTALRLATLYGISQRMRFDLTVNDFAMQMATKKHLVVQAAETWRPYVHVADAARGICSLLAVPEKTGGQVYNIGSTCQNFTKAEIVTMVSQQVPEAEVEYRATTSDLRNYRVSFKKFENDLNFVPERRIPAAIADVVHAVRSGAISQPYDAIYRN
jgi:nucleoside-diphosphate-sugar epimerase